MKTVIAYFSNHHGNTRKLLEAIAEQTEIDLIDVAKNPAAKLDEYDVIGFASGVYFSKYHQTLIDFAARSLPEGRRVFFIHTAGSPRESQADAVKEIAKGKNCQDMGTYFCRGFDTFGPFKLIGGIAKGHPDAEDVQKAIAFYKNLNMG